MPNNPNPTPAPYVDDGIEALAAAVKVLVDELCEIVTVHGAVIGGDAVDHIEQQLRFVTLILTTATPA